MNTDWTWKSWVESANERTCDFPLQNLPYCVYYSEAGDRTLGVAIGDFVLDLRSLASSPAFQDKPPELREACARVSLNALMQCGKEAGSLLRRTLLHLLRDDADPVLRNELRPLLTPINEATFALPVEIGDYTDFYASIQHATNVGSLFRPEQPLLPNYKYVPIAYHGRTSSIVASGHPVVRPLGQIKLPSSGTPSFGLTQQLDYEVEIGVYLGTSNELGQPIPIQKAEEHLFGLTLVNDWSARDIQAWEYQPLGPFLGKSFTTTVSPWVVPMDAIEPFRAPLAERAPVDPPPLPYLTLSDTSRSAVDLTVEVYLSTKAMRRANLSPAKISSGNLGDLYWSFAQMIAHHTSNGCNLRVGDLLASGTISGDTEGSHGSLLERTRRGASPMHLPNGEIRAFLEDDDEIIVRGFCERAGLPRIGFGECRGTVTSLTSPSLWSVAPDG